MITLDKDGVLTFGFNGINNTNDPSRLDAGDCVDIVNLDVGFDKTLSPRFGIADRGTGITSLFAAANTMHCVKGGKLCSTTDAITTTEITSSPTVQALAEFVQVNDVVVYSDGTYSGVIYQGTAYPFGTTVSLATDQDIADFVEAFFPADPAVGNSNMHIAGFDVETEAGTCLEFFNGAMYYAKDNTIYKTKTFDAAHCDIRFNVIAVFPANVTMIKRVTNGLYVGTTTHTYFLAGDGASFEQRLISNRGVIYGTAATCPGEYVPSLNSKTPIVIWASPLGIFAGAESGNYINMSFNTVALPGGGSGSACVIDRGGQFQYVCSYTTVQNTLINSYTPAFEDAVSVEAAQSWSVNLLTGAHSRYSNFPAQSICKYAGRYYASLSTDSHELTGVTTEDCYAITSSIDFGENNLKIVPDMFIAARHDGEIRVDVYVDEEFVEDECIAIFNDSKGMQQRRVTLPKGLLGFCYKFKISVAPITSTTITQVSMKPVITKRKTK